MEADSTYRAVADGTRREIMDMLQQRGPLRAGEIAERFPQISRPAVSRHLRILRESRLVQEAKSGRERWYSANPLPLSEVYDWVRRYERFWADKLDELARLAESPQKPRQ